MDTSKNRLFLATLMLIGMGFVAGVYLSYTEYSAHGQSVADLKKARDLSGRLLAGSPVADVTEPVALKQGNVDSAQKDLEDLKAHIAKLRETPSRSANCAAAMGNSMATCPPCVLSGTRPTNSRP